MLLRYGRRQFGKQNNNEKATIKTHKRASQTENCGSVLVYNANKGTLELKKRHQKSSLHWNTASCLAQWLYGDFVDAESKFLSHLTKLFLAQQPKAKIISKDVHYKSRILAEESRYTVNLMHVRVALICSRVHGNDGQYINVKLDRMWSFPFDLQLLMKAVC